MCPYDIYTWESRLAKAAKGPRQVALPGMIPAPRLGGSLAPPSKLPVASRPVALYGTLHGQGNARSTAVELRWSRGMGGPLARE